MNTANNLLWIDLEMTGLNSSQDVILEIAAIVTDSALNIVAQGPSLVIYQSEEKLALMNEWVRNHHTKTGLIDAVRASHISIADAQQQVLSFAQEYGQEGTMLLCGNSIWQDRSFLCVGMPKLIAFCHYRMIDVSTVKELVLRWFPHDPHAEFKKEKSHRALDDIRESIAELAHYRTYFFIPSSLNT
jgi:oligoribonuclease